MGGPGGNGKENSGPEVYRIRRSEILGMGTLALLGFLFTVGHSKQVEFDAKIRNVRTELGDLRKELYQEIRDVKSDIRREMDAKK